MSRSIGAEAYRGATITYYQNEDGTKFISIVLESGWIAEGLPRSFKSRGDAWDWATEVIDARLSYETRMNERGIIP